MNHKEFLGVSTEARPFIVAEAGHNHEGDIDVAREMIYKAKEGGADAIKFQTIIPGRLVSPSFPITAAYAAEMARASAFSLPFDNFIALKEEAEKVGILFFSTPFDVPSAKMLVSLGIPAFKIGSGQIDLWPMVDIVARACRPVILSTGASTIADVRTAIGRIRAGWGRMNWQGQLVLLNCTSMYPTPSEHVHLRRIQELHRVTRLVGFSDHTEGIQASVLAAVMFDTFMIEKHFTLDKNFSDFCDHKISATAEDLKDMIRLIMEGKAMIGSETRPVLDDENQSLIRHSACAARALPEGHTLNRDDIVWLRPQHGVKPGEERQIFGKNLKVAKEDGETIKLDDVCSSVE